MMMKKEKNAIPKIPTFQIRVTVNASVYDRCSRKCYRLGGSNILDYETNKNPL